MICSAIGAVLFFLLSSSVSAAPTDSQSCRHHYQEALTEALKIREQCENAAFQDCCQVGWSSFHSIPSTFCELCMRLVYNDWQYSVYVVPLEQSYFFLQAGRVSFQSGIH